jgi:hypothetical protein
MVREGGPPTHSKKKRRDRVKRPAMLGGLPEFILWHADALAGGWTMIFVSTWVVRLRGP